MTHSNCLIHVYLFIFLTDNIKDFTDFLIEAKMEASKDDEENTSDKLTDRHLVQTLTDIFFGMLPTHLHNILSFT